MTGQNKKTQSTSQRKNISSQEEAVQNITSSKNKNTNKNIRPNSNNKKTSASSSQTEVEELNRKISELENKNNELTNQNTFLQYKIENYESLQSLNDDNDSQAEVISDYDNRPARRPRKKASVEEEKAKSIIKTLLKTLPELELKEEEKFTSKTNNDICQQLIPKLQKELKTHKYNPSYEQVRTWLKSIHRSKRNAYMKSNPSNQPNPTSLDEEVDNEQEAESDGAIQSAKRQTKSKVKKLGNLTEDYDGSKNKEWLKIEDGAKSLMKRLLEKIYTQDEYKFKVEDTFKSQANIDICRMLIPKLQEDVKPVYNLSYDQVENWLQSIHKTKRNAYLRSNQSNRSNPTSLNNESDYLQEAESDDAIRSAKQETKSKGRNPCNLSEDEDGLKIEEGAKFLMKTLLETFPVLELKEYETFKSEANVEICRKLIPKLQKEMKAYNPSYEQVESWLQSIHKSKSYAYLKSNQLNQSNPISLDDELDYLQEVESDVTIRQTKPKERKPSNVSEDKDELKNEEKSLMKTLLETFPELELKIDETFKSEANVIICQKLIPKLQKEMKEYNLSYKQVETWLQSIHKSKRNTYLKSSQLNQLNQSNPISLDDELDYLQEVESDVTIRQTKPKERKPSNVSEDEDELKNEEGSKIGEGPKSLMKRLLDKTYTQNKYKLKVEETFKSQVNTDICEILIPKLQEDIKPVYNLSYKQVETWLQSIHKSKRNTYLKSNQLNQSNPISLDDELDYLQDLRELESDFIIRRQTKSKVKKLGYLTEDDDGSKNKEGLKLEEEVKSLMKRLLEKTYTQDEYKFKVEDTFKSQANIDICKMLIPMLQEDVKPMYNPSYEQVENCMAYSKYLFRSQMRIFKFIRN
ncbi:unnamed protein product [Rhizophagus irregularis]|nr:unnamed protein product [Rhizophagus irregularis]